MECWSDGVMESGGRGVEERGSGEGTECWSDGVMERCGLMKLCFGAKRSFASGELRSAVV